MNRQAQKLNFNGTQWFLINKYRTFFFYVLELTGKLCFTIVSDAKTKVLAYIANFRVRLFNFDI